MTSPDTFSYRATDGRQLAGYHWAPQDGHRSQAPSFSSMAWVSTSADTTTSPTR